MNKASSRFFQIIVTCLILFIILLLNVYGQALTLTIGQPRQNSNVCQRAIVSGTVSDPRLQVFIAIHPMAANRFWIQPVPNVASNGRWQSYCYFGKPGTPVGQPFEIIAFASNNRNLFTEGNTLPSPFPNNAQILIRTNPVIVTRANCLQ